MDAATNTGVLCVQECYTVCYYVVLVMSLVRVC